MATYMRFCAHLDINIYWNKKKVSCTSCKVNETNILCPNTFSVVLGFLKYLHKKGFLVCHVKTVELLD
jgi:hypothetical protein